MSTRLWTASINGLNIRAYTATSAAGPHPEVTVECEKEFVVIGGGARVNADEPGNLLTAIVPVDERHWRAKAKDHRRPSPDATVTACCIAAQVRPEDVFVAQATNVGSGRVSAHAPLPSEYALLGGGARTWWEHPPWPGSLLTASFGSSNAWSAEAKDHNVPSPVVVTAFAIGLSRALMARHGVRAIVVSATSAQGHHPRVTANLQSSFAAAPGAVGVMTGGGARADSQGPGSLLTESDPQDKTRWIAASKDHEAPDPATVESFAFGLVGV